MIKFGYNKNCKDKKLLGKVAGYKFHDAGNGEHIELAGNGPFICSDVGFAELQRVFPDCYKRIADGAEINNNLQDAMNKNSDQRSATSNQKPAINASKAAKQLAETRNLDLATIDGSGKAGQITKPDVQAVIDATVGQAVINEQSSATNDDPGTDGEAGK